MLASRALYWLLRIVLFVTAIVFCWTLLRDESIGPVCSLIFKCWAKSDGCQLRALSALFPAERLAAAPRFAITITDSGMAGAEVLYQFAFPIIGDSFPILGVAAVLNFAAIWLLRFTHNQAAHVITIIATACPDQTRPERYCDLPNLL